MFGADGKVDADKVHEWLGTEQGVLATPHSQRSVAQVKVLLDHTEGEAFPITALIDLIEGALKTPVQTAVKREDEQEFALLNGQNLMFCEDAARRFIALVDEFYERNVKLIISAQVALEELYTEGLLSFEFRRCLSRLKEMQSHEYLATEHLP